MAHTSDGKMNITDGFFTEAVCFCLGRSDDG
jgi:hypothetical protein